MAGNTEAEYSVYPGWHCYKSEDKAVKAAEKYKNGYEDVLGEDIQSAYSASVEAAAAIP